MTDALWDDSAFKKRVEAIAKQRRLSVADALRAAGITPRYFSRASGGRSINLLLNLAKALDVQPVELLGLNEPPAIPAVPVDSEKLQRILCAAKFMTAQVAALVYVASDGSGADPAALVEAVMARVNGNQSGGEPKNTK